MIVAVVGVAALCAVPIAGQQTKKPAEPLPTPTGWQWITDQPAQHIRTLDPPKGSWLFGVMAPGWHITTGPGALLYEPAYAGRGRFLVESQGFLFPGEGQAGYGLMLGGQNLGTANARYTAFLLRRDKQVAVERHRGAEVTMLQPWTPVGAIKVPATADAAPNTLRVEVEADRARFLINGTVAADVPRDGDTLDGIIGMRIGPDLNLHIATIDVTLRLALPPASKSMP